MSRPAPPRAAVDLAERVEPAGGDALAPCREALDAFDTASVRAGAIARAAVAPAAG